jgi:hypothetical protein
MQKEPWYTYNPSVETYNYVLTLCGVEGDAEVIYIMACFFWRPSLVYFSFVFVCMHKRVCIIWGVGRLCAVGRSDTA